MDNMNKDNEGNEQFSEQENERNEQLSEQDEIVHDSTIETDENVSLEYDLSSLEKEQITNDSIDEKNTKEKSTSEKVLEEIFSWVKVIVIALILSLLLNKYLIFSFTVPTESMENTIMVDNRILSLRCAYWFSDPERGDIVVFPYPDNPEETYIKRVIGLPGETIEGIEGYVYIDGKRLDETYVTSELEADFGPYEIPEDSYFVMGDNRDVSLDARYWNTKFVKKEDIISKAVLRFYPNIHLLK